MTSLKNIFFLFFILNIFSAIFCLKSNLVELDETNWQSMLTEEWMVEFYAPWCPACRNLKPTWEEFSKLSGDFSVKVASIDVTKNPGLSGRFMVTALPTIYHVKDGVFRQYTSNRDSASLLKFIDEKNWKKIDPVSKWIHPSSIQMTIVSWFFKVSMAIRAIHNRLVEDYGLPYWGSYILFALIIILIGIVISLLIVCTIDLVFPAKVDDSYYQKIKTSGDSKESTSSKDDSKNKDDEDELIENSQNSTENKKDV